MVPILRVLRLLGVLYYAATPVRSWTSNSRAPLLELSQRTFPKCHEKSALSMVLGEKEKERTKPLTPEETTEKYGLEAGLFQSLRQQQSVEGGEGGDGKTSAAALLKKYGIAYLATSIPLAIISFAICYILVDNGVDVGALLQKIPGLGSIDVGENGERVGTAAIAYAAHKAASPIRFPPTVLLTPVVAKLIGKEPNNMSDEETE